MQAERLETGQNPLMCSRPASVHLCSRVQPLEFGQPFDVLQSRIGHPGVRQVSRWSLVNPVRCSSQHRLPGIMKVHPVEFVQSSEASNPASVTWVSCRLSVWRLVNPLMCSRPAIGHLGVPDVQPLEFGQPFEMLKPSIGYLVLARIQSLESLVKPCKMLKAQHRHLVASSTSDWSLVKTLR